MVTARIFIGSVVHYLIVQKVLHGSEILPLERDRMVNGLIALITAQDTTDATDAQNSPEKGGL